MEITTNYMIIKVSDIVNKFNLQVFAGQDRLDITVSGAYISDLLSDVMGNAQEGNLWITLQTHKNVVAVASLRDISAVICVKGYEPDAETINVANQEGIVILGTSNTTFEIAGKLYNYLNK
jgi:predicted transcriptional regulator